MNQIYYDYLIHDYFTNAVGLDGLDSSSFNFQFLYLFSQAFWDHSECINYCWYHRHPHIPKLF